MLVSCVVVTSRRSRDRNRDFQLQATQLLEASCLFSFKLILLRTSGKCQSIKRTACMLNFIYIVQCKWYLRLKLSVQGPFKHHVDLLDYPSGGCNIALVVLFVLHNVLKCQRAHSGQLHLNVWQSMYSCYLLTQHRMNFGVVADGR